MWAQLATPVAARMLQYVQQADMYPMLPNGRPPIGGPAYPWWPAVYAQPGPGYNLAGAYAGWGAQGVGLTTAWGYPYAQFTPPGGVPLSTPFVANQLVNQAGGIGAVAPGDLIGLAGLRQGLVGNVLGAIDTRQGIIGNRLAAADFNLNYAQYPLAQAVGYREVLEGLDFYVRNMCPAATENGL
jgi:hypothetical protein